MPPLRILLLHDVFPRTSETFVVEQIEALVAMGHEARVLADWSPGHAERIAPERASFLRSLMVDVPMPSTRMGRLSGAAALLTESRASPRLLASLTLHGHDARSLRPLFRAAAFAQQRNRVDLVLCHFGSNALRALPLLDVGGTRVPLVTVFHGFDVSRDVRRRGRKLYRRLFARGDLFVAVSERIRSRLVELGCPPHRVEVHPTGVDLSRFTVRVPEPIGSGGVVRLIAVGRLVEKKGFAALVAAAAAWRRHDVRLEITIIGDGPERGSLERQIARFSLDGQVRLCGWRTHDQVATAIREADVLVQPSVVAADGDEEGIPVAIKEAMATGVPIVATRHSAIPEIVLDGVNGMLVSENAPLAIVDAIERLIDDAELARRISAAARRTAERQFDRTLLDVQFAVALERTVGRGESSPAAMERIERLSAAG